MDVGKDQVGLLPEKHATGRDRVLRSKNFVARVREVQLQLLAIY